MQVGLRFPSQPDWGTQVVRFNSELSKLLTLSTGAPQGCVLSTLLFMLFTNVCRSNSSSTLIFKFSNDTTIVGLITNAEEFSLQRRSWAGRWLVHQEWPRAECGKDEGNDHRLQEEQDSYDTISYQRTTSRTCGLIKIPWHYHRQHLKLVKWDINAETIAKKAQQRMFFLRQLKQFRANKSIVTQFGQWLKVC